MLKNAIFYEEALQKALIETWYDPKYQYFYGSDWRGVFNIRDGQNRHDFVSVDTDENLIGYIGYRIFPVTRLASDFGIINFTDNKATFGRDLRTAVDDIFRKFGVETLEFSMICSNPIERSYDRAVARMGGRVLCIRHARCQDLAGNICDEKLYEVTRDEYFRAMQR